MTRVLYIYHSAKYLLKFFDLFCISYYFFCYLCFAMEDYRNLKHEQNLKFY